MARSTVDVMARVIYKSPIKTSMSGNETYILFSLLNETGEIRALAFANATTNLPTIHRTLEINNVYHITGARCYLGQNASEYYDFPNNDVLIIDNSTIVRGVEDPRNINIPLMPEFKFQPITKIKTLQIATYVDVIGVCDDVSKLISITKSDGSTADIRYLTLIGEDGETITLSLWREDAVEFNRQDKPVIVARNAKVNSVGWLDFVGGSILLVNPNIPEVSSTAQAVQRLRRFVHIP